MEGLWNKGTWSHKKGPQDENFNSSDSISERGSCINKTSLSLEDVEDVESDDNDLDDSEDATQVQNLEMEKSENEGHGFFKTFLDEVNQDDTTTPPNQSPKKFKRLPNQTQNLNLLIWSVEEDNEGDLQCLKNI